MAFASQSGRLAMRILSYRTLADVGKDLLDALREGDRTALSGTWPFHPLNTTRSRDEYWSALKSFAPFFFEKYVPCLYAACDTKEVDYASFTADQIDAFVGEMRYEMEFYAHMLRRCFITTPIGPLGSHIGCGSDAVRPSDEVFVLYGVGKPTVVRRIGKDGHYKYVGNCYLNGIMAGEAPELGFPVEDILLV